MNAGRELDALVAEKVMGLGVMPGDPGYPEYWWQGPTADYRKLVPQYSTDIAAAWEVVRVFAEAATRRDVYPTIWWSKTGDYWTCELGSKYSGTGQSAPEAICLAALKAVGG